LLTTRILGTSVAGQSDGPSSGFIIGLSIAVPTLLIFLGVLLVWAVRRRRQKHAADREHSIHASSSSRSPRSFGKVSTNSSWRSGAPSPRNSPPANNPTHRLHTVQEHQTSSARPTSRELVPNRSDTGTPIAELETPSTATTVSKNLSTLFQTRRATLPPLPRLKIDSSYTQHSNSRMPFSTDLVSALSPVALSKLAGSNHARSISCNALYTPSEPSRAASASSLSPQPQNYTPSPGPGPSFRSPLSPNPTGLHVPGPGSEPSFWGTTSPGPNNQSSSAAAEPPTRPGPAFPYGYQSEYPEVMEPPPAVIAPADRQREMQFLAEEERLVRERVRATEELIRLKNEEARILDRKRQLGIGRCARPSEG
jgi:hypothetical protein